MDVIIIGEFFNFHERKRVVFERLFFFKEREKKISKKKLRKILTLRKIPTLRKISPISLDRRLARHSPFQVASTLA